MLVLLLLLMGDSVVLLLSSSPFCRCAKPKCYLVHVHGAVAAKGKHRGGGEELLSMSLPSVGRQWALLE